MKKTVFVIGISLLCLSVYGQVEREDSLIQRFNRLVKTTDSLQQLVNTYQKALSKTNIEKSDLQQFSAILLHKIDSLNQKIVYWKTISDTLTENYHRLIPVNRELQVQISAMEKQIAEQNKMLEKQNQLLFQKDLMFKEKEDIYREALMGTKIDAVKLEGQLTAKEKEIEGKKREIELLARSIEEKQSDLEKKNQEITELFKRREIADKLVDSLKDTLFNVQKAYLQTAQENRFLENQVQELKARLSARDKKGKPVAIVQGVALRAFRTPLYVLAPQNSQNITKYEIINENAGSFEFDMITGASVRIMRLTPEDARYSSDLGWFVGFGGKNLFKNFYIGPNIKVFDFIHINAGVNIAEFRVLKSGGSIPKSV
ncbi:MAG TPA: hypothetical protein PK990_10840 [Salinivirgaceae bacterium]|nr:hypothetical protein [Salinivirgaceae bacterium]